MMETQNKEIKETTFTQEDMMKLKGLEKMNTNDNTPVYNWEDSIKFIHDRCNLSEDVIIEVLEFEEEYMKSVGIIVEEE